MPACHGRRFKGEANRRRHRLTEPTTKALCPPPPPPTEPLCPAAPWQAMSAAGQLCKGLGHWGSFEAGIWKSWLECPCHVPHPHVHFSNALPGSGAPVTQMQKAGPPWKPRAATTGA